VSAREDNKSATEFDSFADNYSEALRAGLSVTGQSQEYYAAGRIRLLADRAREIGRKYNRVLDFGCGQGASTPLLRSELGARFAVGADVSDGLLQIARRLHSDPKVSYVTISDLKMVEPFDCVYMNGVLHHIPPQQRLETLSKIFEALRPGGLFALWENNPWNPGTRYVMKRIPFDRDAMTLTIPESCALLEEAGFSYLSTDTAFFFPGFLSFLAGLERALSRTKLGGQYMILSERRVLSD
jgi:SAM-dependent methyltransferase